MENNIDKNKVNRLKELLKKLNEGNVSEELKNETLEVVKTISPLELSLAEQKLIDEGMNPTDLRHLCDIHMEVLKDELEKLKANIIKGHVLYTLVAEHDEITKLLNELEEINKEIQQLEKYDESNLIYNRLVEVATLILEAELHHKREEDVLFKNLEDLEITGPTRIMRMEHDTLRIKKRAIKELGNTVKYLDFQDFKDRLDPLAKELVYELKDHIFKENYILYPTALESIKSEEQWEEMRKACDEIGYCPFTPKEIL
ncbi:MAG: DUF438 domain-containing protein [Sarcina sp.]